MARVLFGVRRRWLRGLGALAVLAVASFWWYTASQSDWRIRDTLSTQFQYVDDLALSPDGSVLALVGHNDDTLENTAELWHLPTRRLLKTFGNVETRDEFVVEVEDGDAVVFSPNGRSFAINTYRSVEVWDLDSMRRRVTCELSSWADSLDCFAYSPDGTTIAIAGLSHDNGEVGQVWDVNTGREVATFSTTYSYSIAFSPDGNWIASGGPYDEIVVYNLATCKSRTLSAFDSIESVAFSPDGKTLAAVESESGITLWDVETWSKKATLEIPRFASCVTFSPNGAYLVAGGYEQDSSWWDRLPLVERCLTALGIERQYDGEIYVYDARTLEQVTTLKGHSDGIMDCVFSADSRTLVTCGDDTVLFWEVPD